MKTQFLQNWTTQQHKTAEQAIVKYLRSRFFETLHSGENTTPFCGCKTFRDFDAILGLAYTSSSSFAGLFICNTELYLDTASEFGLVGFAMDKNHFVYAIWQDKKERELTFPIN
jgi:hypothetical protein